MKSAPHSDKRASSMPRANGNTSGRIIALTMVSALAASAAAIAATVVLIRPPDTLDQPQKVANTPVSVQLFDESLSAELRFSITAATDLTAVASGVVTSSSCVAGTAIESGHTLLRVNAQPIVALATEIPLWRSLAQGDSGPDVLALETELLRLGYLDEADDFFGRSTADAIETMFEANGERDIRTLALEQIVWLPASSVTPQSCSFTVGDVLAESTSIASLPAGVLHPEISTEQQPVYQGDRVFVADSQTFQVTPDLTVDDDESLLEIADFVSRQEGEARSEYVLSGTLRLASPVEVSAVPPSALYGVDGSSACVLVEGQAERVTIVGSQLGSSFVRFEGAPPEQVSASPEATQCQ